MEKISADFEIILVDDGSPDNSRAIAEGFLSTHPQLRIIELSRNFGHHAAMLAGLAAARGELIFYVDSDLEENPELAFEFHRIMDSGDMDVVYGFYTREAAPLLRRITSTAFWWVIAKITDISIPRNIANVRLMRRQYVEAVLSLPDRNIFLGGMFAWPGFRQEGVQIHRTPRQGESTYTWRRRLQLAGKAAVSFSDKPLLIVFGLGLTLTALSFAVGLFNLLQKLLNPDFVLSGFTSIMISVWFLGGVMLGCTGVLGFYIAHIYNQSRARPRYIIRREHASQRAFGNSSNGVDLVRFADFPPNEAALALCRLKFDPENVSLVRGNRVAETLEDVRTWFAHRSQTLNGTSFVIIVKHRVAGYATMESASPNGKEMFVGINVLPDYRGTTAALDALNMLKSEAPQQATMLIADVLTDNIRSQRLFKKAGYVLQGQENTENKTLRFVLGLDTF